MNGTAELTSNENLTGELGGIFVSRRELENERAMLINRLQQLQRLLGLEPIQTGKQQRRERSINN